MEQDLSLLQNISDTLKSEPEASQRQLAQNAKISIGLMNAVLKRFVERGWIMLTNVNGRKLAYALTPAGMNELYNRGKSFTIRTFSAANEYNQILFDIIRNAKSQGKTSVRLYGGSQIKFLLVYVCSQLNIDFIECSCDQSAQPDSVCFAGEFCSEEVSNMLVAAGAFSLVDLMNHRN